MFPGSGFDWVQPGGSYWQPLMQIQSRPDVAGKLGWEHGWSHLDNFFIHMLAAGLERIKQLRAGVGESVSLLISVWSLQHGSLRQPDLLNATQGSKGIWPESALKVMQGHFYVVEVHSVTFCSLKRSHWGQPIFEGGGFISTSWQEEWQTTYRYVLKPPQEQS